ncbi:GntR family transcriptional regulator [Catenulispora rubra]|uniref:GntR family transcriptional regulator n=1 Tax=Catenulispora rubra TaxID=280293 RepID=UPI0018925641|nr:GntR family transcriptional regulator [Catenulispora rubra]
MDTTNTTDDSPLWKQIADQLRADIAREIYAPGAPLPGEHAMATRYNTSRPTVRRAITELAGEGLVTAAQGRGTFVRPRPDRRLIAINAAEHPDLLADDFNPTRIGWDREEHPDAARFQQDGTTRVTNAVITAATRDQAEALGIRTGELIYYRFTHWRHRHTQRVISITSTTPAHLIGLNIGQNKEPATFATPPVRDEHDEPFEHDDVFDNTDHEPDDAHDPANEEFEPAEPDNTTIRPLYDRLADSGATGYATTITARMPRGDELNDLGTEPGTPILQIRRAMTDQHGRTLEVTTIEAPADRFEVITSPAPARTAILTV